MKKRAKSGDIFVEKLQNGQYMFGRVLMDIQQQCFKTKIVEKVSSNLRHVSTCYLIEAYDTISNTPQLPKDYNTVIKGICVSDMAIEDDVWQIIGNTPVDLSTIDFEEQISYYNGEVYLYKGELALEAKIENDGFLQLPRYAHLGSLNLFNVILDMLGKGDLASREISIKMYDARFDQTGMRELAYKALGEDPKMSYVDMALKHGFDTSRFFQQKDVKSKTKIDLKNLLKDVSWTFDGDEFATLQAFREKIKSELTEDRKIPLKEIEILVEFNDENDKDHELQFKLKAENGLNFTESELLFKINNKITKQLADLDKHFFEGLSLLKKSQPPLYSLNLGS